MTYLHLYTFYIYHVCIKQFEQADMAFTSYVFSRGCIEMRVGSVAGGVQDTLWMGDLIRFEITQSLPTCEFQLMKARTPAFSFSSVEFNFGRWDGGENFKQNKKI